MGSKATKWGHPTVLFSKGKKNNKYIPPGAFTNQALHCDFQPEVANANAKRRGKPVPYSIIVNCSPDDAIIFGCGLSPRSEVIAMTRHTRENVYADLPDPVPIIIPTGCMVAFRGDYVHGGSSYARNHTRLFMGLQLMDDVHAVNTTFLHEHAKHPPSNIIGEPIPGALRDTGIDSRPDGVCESSKTRKASKGAK